MTDSLKGYEGKKVKIILKNNIVYSGTVKEVADVGNGLVFISIIDKFNNFVTFASSELVRIEQIRGEF